MHGGNTPRGMASPHYKDGKYSRHAPKLLAERIEAATRDGTLTDLTDEIAVIQALAQERIAMMGQTTSAEDWSEAARLWAEYGDAVRWGDEDAASGLRGQMDVVLERGTNVQGHEDAVLKLFDKKARMVKAHSEQRMAAGLTLSYNAVVYLVGQVLSLVTLHVKDPAALTAIRRGVMELRSGDARDGASEG